MLGVKQSNHWGTEATAAKGPQSQLRMWSGTAKGVLGWSDREVSLRGEGVRGFGDKHCPGCHFEQAQVTWNLVSMDD